MKINRLLEITMILLNKGTVTAGYLAERFGVSTRTIYRDIDELTLSGIPIYTNKGKGGGISLLENFSINRTLLSTKEKESILLALRTLQAVQYPEIDTVFHKLGAVFDKLPINDWVEVDFTSWGTNPSRDNRFELIKQAILERQHLSFHYVNTLNQRSIRKIAPMKLIYKSSSWYLKGVCVDKQAYRIFKITRMKQVKRLHETFDREEYQVLEGYQDAVTEIHRQPIEMTLRFHPSMLYRLYDEYENNMTQLPDGRYEVIVRYPYDEWIFGYIFSFGHSVEVVEPVWLRDEIHNRLQMMLDQYKADARNHS